MQESFLIFIHNIGLYPTVIFTGLVMFVTLYWLISLLGMVDMDVVDIGDMGGDASDIGDVDVSDASSMGVFTGILLKFGLYGVPLIFILTSISLIGWVLSYIYTSFLHQTLNSGVLFYVFGTGALLLVLVISMWLTGLIIAPIRKKLANIPKRNSASNLGKVAVIRTLSVTENHGEAELRDGGAGLILKVREYEDSNDVLKQGDKVILVEYIDDINAYRVKPIDNN